MSASFRVPSFVTTLIIWSVALVVPGSAQGQQGDIAHGNLIQFNDNGAWTWYSDERAIVDQGGGKIVVGVDANGNGLGGSSRSGAIESSIFDILSGTSKRYTMLASGYLGQDDHNAPAFMLRPDGKYLAQWTGHNANFLSYFSIYNGTTWGSYTTFDWATVGAVTIGGRDERASYSNPHYLSAEGRAYTFVRSVDYRSMNILVSTNQGDTWTYYGKLNRSYPGSGYNPGYYKFCDNGVDRIDFICTESHPRDTFTSIYHGYISNGMSFKSDGTVVDNNLNDTNGVLSSDFQLVFSNGTVMPPGMTNKRCWNSDVQRYADGTIEAIIHARFTDTEPGGYSSDPTINPNHTFFFCRWDGTNWNSTYLCKAGFKLYSSEADYIGLGCLSPNDPNTIYISTKYDPRAVQPGVNDTNAEYSACREIWKGVTTNHGTSFTWTPITQNSIYDNLRPIVPKWDTSDTALIWFRGHYTDAQHYDEAPVGIVEHRSEVVGQMHYVDATAGSGGNTMLTNGSTLNLSSSINQWHSQTGVGNGGTILSSADSTGENAAPIMTLVTVPGPGTYDVWVNFWGNPSADWRIQAGLTPDTMQTYRSQKCEQVQPWIHDAALVLTNTTPANNYLYQAYAGRAVASSSNTIAVLVDDNSIQTGGTGTTHVGNTCRTWYDGVSYAKVEPFQIQSVSRTGPSTVALVWNSPPPEMSLTTPTYTVQKTSSLAPPVAWTTVATGIPGTSEAYLTTNVDNSASGSTAFYRVTWP